MLPVHERAPMHTSGASGQVGVEETLAEVEVLGLYFAASWCPSCRSTTPMIASAYKMLRGRGKALQIVFVSQDSTEADFETYRRAMPWPALPHGGSLPALLAEVLHVASIPCLVLLNKDGALVSTDGVRLLRKHARSFPWTASVPVETPHHHPLFERLLRRDPVDGGIAHELPTYTPLDFLQQPAKVNTFDDAFAAVRQCDRLCTLTAVQAHCVKNTTLLKISLIQHTFTQLLPMPRPTGHVDEAACLWRSPMLYAQQLDLMLLLQRLMEHFASSAFSVDHTRSIDAVRMVVPACIAAVGDAVMRQIAIDIPSEVSIHLSGALEGSSHSSSNKPGKEGGKERGKEGGKKRGKEGGKERGKEGGKERGKEGGKERPTFIPAAKRVPKGFALGAAALARQAASVCVHTPELNTARTCALDYFQAQASMTRIFAWEKTGAAHPWTRACPMLRVTCECCMIARGPYPLAACTIPPHTWQHTWYPPSRLICTLL